MTDTETWAAEVRIRLRLARTSRGLTWAAAAAASGVPSPGHYESGHQAFLYLHHVLALCRTYSVSFAHMVDGWPGWQNDKPPPRHEVQLDPIDDVVWNVRRTIRLLRGDRGTPQVAEAAWGQASQQSTLSRWESGTYQRMDLARLLKLAEFFQVPLPTLIGSPA